MGTRVTAYGSESLVARERNGEVVRGDRWLAKRREQVWLCHVEDTEGGVCCFRSLGAQKERRGHENGLHC